MLRKSVGACLVLVFVLMLGAGGAWAQNSAVPDLSDGWVRLDTVGSGEFGNLTSHFTPAVLTPDGEVQVKAAPRRQLRFDFLRDPSTPRREGEAYIVTEGRCGGNAVPLEPNSAAFFLTQTRDKVLITREGAGARHIFLDGRPHPDPRIWVPAPLGHSVARYEDDALVVETIGFTAGSVTAGGWRSPETRLVERFEASSDGRQLTITYTWNDPAIYRQPHSYALTFERLPEGSYAIENWCDSSDPANAQSIVVPEQRR